jgi:hypothetical protein
LATACVFTLLVQLPRIDDPFMIEEDFRNYHWIYRYQDPELFPDESLDWRDVIEVEAGPRLLIWESASPGYSLLFRIASSVLDPVLFSKLMAFPLMLLAVYYAYRIGEQLAGKGLALALSLTFVVLNLASSTELSVAGGLHRSFSMPILFGLIYYLMQARYIAAALFVFLSGIIYAPILPICALSYVLSCVSLRENSHWRLQIHWRDLTPLLISILLVMIALSPMLISQVRRAQEGIGSSYGGGVLADPNRQEGGRGQLFTLFPFIGRGGITTNGEDAFHLLVLAILAALTWLLRRSKAILVPPVLVKLFYASLIGFVVAWLAALTTSSFLLYLPSRHTRASFFAILLIFVMINARETLNEAAAWVVVNRRRLIWYVIPVALTAVSFAFFLPDAGGRNAMIFRGPAIRVMMVALTAVFIILAGFSARKGSDDSTDLSPAKTMTLSRRTWVALSLILAVLSLVYINLIQPSFHSPTQSAKSLFAYLETLPVDAMIAGNPCNLTDIPFYAKRSVLFNCERFPPDDELIIDTLTAYYSEDGREIYDFCHKYGVTHLVVNENTFTPDFLARETYFFEPYNSVLAPIVASHTQFALNQVPEEAKLFQVEDVFVAACNTATFGLSNNTAS